MSRREFDSWLLCATPRSGSTLLCGLLRSSGVAGRPASYFRRQGLHEYATAWRVVRPVRGGIDAAYLHEAINAGTTSNGIFAARIMAESRPELLSDLAAIYPAPGNDLELLSRAFGRLRFVHLRRLDVVAQAVSWAKALQTHFWHPEDPVEPGGIDPHYDEQLITRLIEAIRRFEADWQRWFATQQIDPCEVTYEQLAADPLAVAHRVLDFLGLQNSEHRSMVVGHQRQADQINAHWIDAFKASNPAPGPTASPDTGGASSSEDRRPPFDAVLDVLSREDPEGLVAAGAPADEYAREAADLAERLRSGQPVTSDVLVAVWEHWFGPDSGYVRRTSTSEIATLADELNTLG